VKIYDGDDLIGDQHIDVVEASGGDYAAKETFTIIMINGEAQFEEHQIKVFVNKQRAINEGPQNYKNNEKQELLVVTGLTDTTPSFATNGVLMMVSVSMVVLASMFVLRKLPRKKEEE